MPHMRIVVRVGAEGGLEVNDDEKAAVAWLIHAAGIELEDHGGHWHVSFADGEYGSDNLQPDQMHLLPILRSWFDPERRMTLSEVSPALVEELRRLGREYGPTGVMRTAQQLVREHEDRDEAWEIILDGGRAYETFSVPEKESVPLVDDLANVLSHMVVSWEAVTGVDLAQHPEVQRVMSRYREYKRKRTGVVSD